VCPRVPPVAGRRERTVRRIWILAVLAAAALLLSACGPGGHYLTGAAGADSASVSVPAAA